jgi:flagellar L-ring protein precursor FlgH
MVISRWSTLVVAATTIGLGACSLLPKGINREPALSPVVTVVEPVTPPKAYLLNGSLPHGAPKVGSSTWSDKSADLYRDARAIRPGDILTVKISIKDRASFDSSANRSRDAKIGSQGKLDFGIGAFGLNKSGTASLDANNESKSSTDASGAVTRAETLDLLVAATVVEILPSGNLIIRGQQEVRLNYELRVLSVEGIVRARDISTDNSVSYDKIAEARIAYGGQGRTMEVLQPPVGQQIVDRFAPF